MAAIPVTGERPRPPEGPQGHGRAAVWRGAKRVFASLMAVSSVGVCLDWLGAGLGRVQNVHGNRGAIVIAIRRRAGAHDLEEGERGVWGLV